MIVSVSVEQDDATKLVSEMFDYQFTGTTEFVVPEFEPKGGITAIVGPSGTGKTSILRQLGITPDPSWLPHKAIVSQFGSPKESIQRLMSVGLNSVPTWLRPFHVLSNGEQFRAKLARQLGDGCVIDEFSSVVDRPSAKAGARAVGRIMRGNGWSGTFATVHKDIIPWLNPDHVFDTRTGWLPKTWEEPKISFEVVPCSVDLWKIFAPHHYLSSSILKSARCFCAYWEGELVGFASAIAMPNGNIRNAWREHRTVILPDYQGLGIGVRLSDRVAQAFLDDGKRYFSRTAHPRMGSYRDSSPLWRPTSKNRKARTDYNETNQGRYNSYFVNTNRVCWSHEYVGKQT